MKEAVGWLSAHWFDVVQSVGIIGSLLFSIRVVRASNKVQRVANLFQLTQYHREIWSLTFTHPELRNINRSGPEFEAGEISSDERLFVSLLIHHLSSAFEAHKVNAIVPSEGLRRDVVSFFGRPIPRKIWQEVRSYQNEDFVYFVESSPGFELDIV